ncbi:hypothetical protein [Sphingomonas lycopersici]|uniref:Uncharacterized protein n=1 Tax=Sphingomonas lycopersici TaxID=2951807 RepID=A0AA41Z9U6_9SPHN|nr:hypothetical protein [Sphingomonas lycopersici]MCW6535613.1 hypothetical protein [Sphingomonas lycopersici]
MLSSPKPLASLSSGLLARKGQARPAMRPQGYANLASAGDALGWNDMGDAPAVAPAPPVLAEREALREEVERAPAPAAIHVSVATAVRLRRETAHRRKAAFTLRLDEDRHLRLRLASATRNRSAQQIVTEALDAFIASLPEVETLVAQLPPRKKR